MELTVVLTGWKRPENIEAIVRAFDAQSIRHKWVYWDNAGRQLVSSPLHPEREWYCSSTKNLARVPRWFVAAHADTPYVVIVDDDLLPADPEVLADTLESLQAHDGAPVGAWGVILDPGKRYHECRHIGSSITKKYDNPITEDTPVDILKARFFAVAVDRLANLPMKLDFEDDIAVSSLLGGGTVLAKLQGRFTELPTGKESVSCRAGHMQKREAARRRWFGVSSPLAAAG